MRAVQKSYQHPRFKERAKGEFINYAGKDTLIYQALERIRKNIQSQQKTHFKEPCLF